MRVGAVDVTGLPVGALVVLASTHGNPASEPMPEHLTRRASPAGLELVRAGQAAARAGNPLPTARNDAEADS